jgi:hypothetical protein
MFGIACIMILALFFHYKYADEDVVYTFQGLDGDDYQGEISRENLKKPLIKVIEPTSKKPINKKSEPSKKLKYETKCREIIEGIFNTTFESCRPDFLKNPVTGQNLELDCYNPQLKIALEYDGQQHAQYTPHFHRNDKWKFIYQVRKDDWKNLKCQEHGITLVRVPHTIPFEKLESYIKKKLIKLGKL